MSSDSLTLYKLIVLYMLEQVTFPLTTSQISEFILDREYTNYLTLQQVLSELSEATLVQSDTKGNRTLLMINEEGKNTLSFFNNRISDAIKNEISTFFKENKMELRNEVSIITDYYKSVTGEYEADLFVKEKETTLIHLTLSVPTEEIAATICDHWKTKNEEIYQLLMEKLL
ncbi:MAG: DUF4364 family protein [Eubacteriales bacterium]